MQMLSVKNVDEFWNCIHCLPSTLPLCCVLAVVIVFLNQKFSLSLWAGFCFKRVARCGVVVALGALSQKLYNWWYLHVTQGKLGSKMKHNKNVYCPLHVMCRGTSKAVKILLDMSFIKPIYLKTVNVCISSKMGSSPSNSCTILY